MADSTFLTRDVLAHDYVMQVLNAMLQRPDIITRRQMSTDAMHQNALRWVGVEMQQEAITAGFEYADAFIAAAARVPHEPTPVIIPKNRAPEAQPIDASLGPTATPKPLAPMDFLRHVAERNSAPKAPPGPQGSTDGGGQHAAGGQAGDAAKAPARRRKAGRRSP